MTDTISDERLREIANCAEMGQPGVEPSEIASMARALLSARTTQAEPVWPEWATDKHIAEGILEHAETIVQLLIHGKEHEIAEHTGAIKSFAGTLLGREQRRAKYTPAANPQPVAVREVTATLVFRPIHRELLKRGAANKWIWMSDDAGRHTAEVVALGELKRAGLVEDDLGPFPPGPPSMPPRRITDAGREALASLKERT